MMVGRLSLALIALTTAVACQHPNTPRAIAWPDAPADMRDEVDRDQAIDAMWATPLGDGRSRARQRIVLGAASKIGEALDEAQPDLALERLEQLVSLWSEDPQAIGPDLAAVAPLLRQMRARFARSGSLAAVTLVLAVLAEIDPPKRAAYRAEIDEVAAFADEIAIADGGEQARHGQPILLLQPTALVLPLPWIVDRYVALLETRQLTITNVIAAHGASVNIIRSHPDLLRTHRRIANVLARAGRAREISQHLQRIKGIGADRDLATRAEVLADQPTAAAYVALAEALRSEPRDPDDPRTGRAPDHAAALATCQTALATFPTDPTLLTTAASAARALGRIDQPIALYGSSLLAADEV
ncbi:MAG: hypothetical protein NT062_00020, partial [Proteobacteria bacterium]|nr:hypothetical protein [Pseudomonadota bacterium]